MFRRSSFRNEILLYEEKTPNKRIVYTTLCLIWERNWYNSFNTIFFSFNFTDDTSYSSVTISFVGIRKGKNNYHTSSIKNIYNI